MKVTPKMRVDIIEAYETKLETMINLAKRYGVTRQAVYKILKRAGIDTTKRKLVISCSTCDKEFERHKGRIRKQKFHFCSPECYHAFLDAGGKLPYVASRHGQRLARNKVSEYFELKENNVVHHEDRNCLNNTLENLKVFRNQGDHVRYHRWGSDYVEPIWDGATYLQFQHQH